MIREQNISVYKIYKISKIFILTFILSSITLFSTIFNNNFHIDYFSEHLLNEKN